MESVYANMLAALEPVPLADVELGCVRACVVWASWPTALPETRGAGQDVCGRGGGSQGGQ
jgi:hypothetical protein